MDLNALRRQIMEEKGCDYPKACRILSQRAHASKAAKRRRRLRGADAYRDMERRGLA